MNICNLTPEIRGILKHIAERVEIAPQEQFPIFSKIFYYLLLDLYVKIGTIFSLLDKRLFELSEIDITRAN